MIKHFIFCESRVDMDLWHIRELNIEEALCNQKVTHDLLDYRVVKLLDSTNVVVIISIEIGSFVHKMKINHHNPVIVPFGYCCKKCKGVFNIMNGHV